LCLDWLIFANLRKICCEEGADLTDGERIIRETLLITETGDKQQMLTGITTCFAASDMVANALHVASSGTD
jgi:hypothetical protein